MTRDGTVRLAVSVALTVASTGCHEFPSVFIDDLPDSFTVTTASQERARQAEVAPSTRTRGFDSLRIDAQNGTVAHGPLLMEDPIEMQGSQDGQFAVTSEDLLYIPYGLGRYIVNLVLLPVSMVVDPPGSVMCSDGIERRSRVSWLPQPYDAQRCSGTTEPLDVHETWTFHE